MRVLHLINNLNREGAQVVVFNLATAGGGGNARHVVCAREPGGDLQAALAARGIPVHAPDRYHGLAQTRRSLRFLAGIVRDEAIDVVHAHMADAAFLGWRLARAHRLPLVITHHGHDLLPNCGRLCRLVYLLLLAAAAHGAGRNVAVAAPVAETLRRRLRLDAARISVIANGVPVPAHGQWERPDRLWTRAPQVIAVGRLVELKGHAQLLAAAALLVQEFPGAHFTLVGDGPLRVRLQQQVETLGLGGQVTFAGSVADVPERLHAADVYVSTSHYEGMPMATLEAMAWGVPVVASDVPGNRDVVRDGGTGLLFAPGDVAGLAGRIRETVLQPEQARERAGRARALVETDYGMTAVAGAYARVYAEVMQQNERRAGAHSV